MGEVGIPAESPDYFISWRKKKTVMCHLKINKSGKQGGSFFLSLPVATVTDGTSDAGLSRS